MRAHGLHGCLQAGLRLATRRQRRLMRGRAGRAMISRCSTQTQWGRGKAAAALPKHTHMHTCAHTHTRTHAHTHTHTHAHTRTHLHDGVGLRDAAHVLQDDVLRVRLPAERRRRWQAPRLLCRQPQHVVPHAHAPLPTPAQLPTGVHTPDGRATTQRQVVVYVACRI
jgi:hypothetical protein